MSSLLFVTGTDTGVGKTHAACTLLRNATQQGQRTLGLKPIAAGCSDTAEGLRNDDALALMQAASEKALYREVNPIALAQPIAPHLAARLAGRRLTAMQMVGYIRGTLSSYPHDLAVIEGAGGWRVPLNEREYFSDIARELRASVVLVVGLRLGCINHALLTAEAILRDGCTLAGWIANSTDPDIAHSDDPVQTDDIVHAIAERMPAPLLLQLPYQRDR